MEFKKQGWTGVDFYSVRTVPDDYPATIGRKFARRAPRGTDGSAERRGDGDQAQVIRSAERREKAAQQRVKTVGLVDKHSM